MPKGRKPTPTALKKLRGTTQPCRENKNELVGSPLIKLPSAPRWFKKNARKIYRAKGKQLQNLSLLTILDLELFISFCREYGNYLDTSAELDNYGVNNTLDFLAKIDFERIPLEKKDDVMEALMFGEDLILKRIQKINKESWERSKILASEFGFTPSARTKIAMPAGDNDGDNDFD
jgi:P27 family predicted phage terminase small subunit